MVFGIYKKEKMKTTPLALTLLLCALAAVTADPTVCAQQEEANCACKGTSEKATIQVRRLDPSRP